jgi:hypothetical protein
LVVEGGEVKGITRTFDSKRVLSNRERYIAVHEGIDYFQQTEIDRHTEHLAWQKVKDYSKVRYGHEWVWLLDGDAFIMNGVISGLAVVRAQVAKEALNSTREIDIVLCEDLNGINTGSVFLRTSEWTDRFVKRWITYENSTEVHTHKYPGFYILFLYRFL